MNKNSKKGFSDISLIVIVGAVIVLFSLSIFFGHVDTNDKVGNAQRAYALGSSQSASQSSSLSTTQTTSDTATTDKPPCGGCPEGWTCTDDKVCCPPGTTAKHLAGDSYVCVKDCTSPQTACVQTCCNAGQTCQTQPPWPAPDAYGFCFDNDDNECPKGTSACPPKGKSKACCTADEKCTPKTKKGFTVWGCSAVEDACKKKGGTFCAGSGDYKDANLCCTGGSTCFVSPNGMPSCVPPTTTTETDSATTDYPNTDAAAYW